MPLRNKDRKTKQFRLSLVEDQTHKQRWVLHFTRAGLVLGCLSAVTVLLVGAFCLVAYTPLRTFIPGYPDAHTQRTAIRNAIRIDSLQNVITQWEFYTENLRRVVNGEDPVRIDSIVNHTRPDAARNDTLTLHRKDSLLREQVRAAEAFDLSAARERNLPIEGIHFFAPLRGVVSQAFDPAIHPYIDITAPAGTVVMAPLDGTVISAGWTDEAGNTLVLQHAADIISVYKHNQKLLKRTGDKVTAGTPVALVGNTGAATTGDHLHFELWYKGEAVDPAKYIKF